MVERLSNKELVLLYLYAGLLKFLVSADAVNRRSDVSVAEICLVVPGLVFLIECISPYFVLASSGQVIYGRHFTRKP